LSGDGGDPYDRVPDAQVRHRQTNRRAIANKQIAKQS
jgi:hypothetical protein